MVKNIAAMLFLAFIVVGCSNKQINLSTATSNGLLPTKTITVPSKPVYSLTLTPAQTRTAAIQPTKSETPRPALPPRPTRTSQPTIEREEAEKIVQQYLGDNRGCKLPCWWGITPGKTTRDEAETFLEPIGKLEKSDLEDKTWFGYQLFDAPEGAFVESSINYEKDIVSRISVYPNGTHKSYKLYQLLQNYGKPDEVSLQVYRGVPCGSIPFTLFLVYRDQGIIAEFKTETKSVGENLKGCFSSGPTLWLFNATDPERKEVEAFFSKIPAGPEAAAPPILSIDQAVGISKDAFYQKYRASAYNCIFTPENLWPNLDQMESTAKAMDVLPGK